MKKVIIIGAGPAGLTAAFELLSRSRDYDVSIIEEDSQVGGISRTVRYGGNRMDIGGHRFFSKDDRVCSWWSMMMPDQGAPSYDDKLLGRERALALQGPDPEKQDRVMLMRNRVSRIYYKRHFFDYPLSMKPETLFNLGLYTTIKAGLSYLYSAVFKRQEKSLEDFYINRFGRVLYSMFFEGYTEKLWGRHPKDIAPDWGAQRVKGLSIAALLRDLFSKTFNGKRDMSKVETSLIETFRYPKYGPGELWETAADEVERLGGHILTNSAVTKLHVENKRVCRVTVKQNGQNADLECDDVLSSMPLKDLVAGINDVPAAIAEIASGLPYRDFVTVGVLVDKLAIKNKTKIKTINDIIPDCWIYVQDTGVKLGRIQIFNNWSPYLVQDPEHTVWLGLEFFCNEGDSFWSMAEEECVELGVNELKKIGVIDNMTKILDSHRERVRKTYPAYFDTYARLNELKDYLDGIENLYCIGRNGQHRYNNMDHSMETAFAATEVLLSGLKDKKAIWDVNAKLEYHEVK